MFSSVESSNLGTSLENIIEIIELNDVRRHFTPDDELNVFHCMSVEKLLGNHPLDFFFSLQLILFSIRIANVCLFPKKTSFSSIFVHLSVLELVQLGNSLFLSLLLFEISSPSKIYFLC